MPPPESKLILNNKEKAIILKWIDQGASWKEHWSFIKPVLPRVPENISLFSIFHSYLYINAIRVR